MTVPAIARFCGFAIAGAGAALVVATVAVNSTGGTNVAVGLATVPWIAVGSFIVATQPRNPIGWLFSMVGLLWLTGEVVYSWARFETDPGAPLLPLASLYAESYWIPGLGLLLVTVMLFPAGHLPSPRWRPAFGLVVIGLTVAFARAALASSVQAGDDGLAVDNPIGLGVVGPFSSGDEAPVLLFLFAAAITALVSFVVRFRRSMGEERQQLKWMALAVPALVVGWVLAGFVDEWRLLADAIRAASMALIPLAAGFAITRFHLYDVDRVISRTTAYALVTGFLLSVYGVVVTSVTRVVPSSSQWAVALATLTAAAMARPALRWSRRVVDRRFNREQYDAGLAVEAFARAMRDEVQPEHVMGTLLGAVNRTVQPTAAVVWLRGGSA